MRIVDDIETMLATTEKLAGQVDTLMRQMAEYWPAAGAWTDTCAHETVAALVRASKHLTATSCELATAKHALNALEQLSVS